MTKEDSLERLKISSIQLDDYSYLSHTTTDISLSCRFSVTWAMSASNFPVRIRSSHLFGTVTSPVIESRCASSTHFVGVYSCSVEDENENGEEEDENCASQVNPICAIRSIWCIDVIILIRTLYIKITIDLEDIFRNGKCVFKISRCNILQNNFIIE